MCSDILDVTWGSGSLETSTGDPWSGRSSRRSPVLFDGTIRRSQRRPNMIVFDPGSALRNHIQFQFGTQASSLVPYEVNGTYQTARTLTQY